LIAGKPGMVWRALGTTILGFCFFAWLWNPEMVPQVGVCLVLKLTGESCPGCGMVRACQHFLAGRFSAAWQYHPLSFFFLPAGFILAIIWVWQGSQALESLVRHQRWAWAVVSFVGALMIIHHFWRVSRGWIPL
jgi:hypothetical protein